VNKIVSSFEEYRNLLLKSIENIEFDYRIIDVLLEVIANNNKVYLIGNGGSAGTADHMSNDLSFGTFYKNKTIQAISLPSHISLITAISNDLSYDDVFMEMLKQQYQDGDLLIAISGSGNSKNIIKACEYIKKRNGKIISLIGFDGGKIKSISDYYFWVKSDNYGIIEDLHLAFGHFVSQIIKNKFIVK